MEIEKEDLHICRYSFCMNDHLFEQQSPLLSKGELWRYNHYINPLDAKRFLCHRRFMRNVIAAYTAMEPHKIRFELTPYGKPYLKNSKIFLNLAHSGNDNIMAISKNIKIGIDIERIIKIENIPRFTSTYFTKNEIALITRTPLNEKHQAIFAFWTLKEAYIKAQGKGLSLDISKIEMSDYYKTTTSSISASHFKNHWTIQNIKADHGVMAAFAVNEKITNYSDHNYVAH